MQKKMIIGFIALGIAIIGFLIKYIMYTPSTELTNFSVKVNKKYTNVKKEIDKEEKLFNNSELKNKYKIYLNDKHFDKVFITSKSKIEELSKTLSNANNLYKHYKRANNLKILTFYKTVNFTLNTVMKEVKRPLNFLKELDKTIKNKEQLKNKVIVSFKVIEISFNKFQETINNKKALYENKKEDLNKKLKKISNLFEKLKKEYLIVEIEGNKKEPNIEKFMKNEKEFNKNKKEFNELIKKYNILLNQLDRDYSKILIDMKEKPYIIIGRTAWDDYDDYPSEHEYIYPKKYLSEIEYKHFIKNGNDTVGILNNGFFGDNKVSAKNGYSNSYVQSVIRDPKRNWYTGDDSAEYWISDLGAEFYHKYKIIENGKIKTTDWIKVKEDTYQDNLANLGMAIVTKPKGYYDSEKKVIPTPPGMAYVGNKNYGEWKQDSNGHSFWHYYGMYSFFSDMLGGNSYSRNDYDTYHRYEKERKPYYGGGKYGSNGSYTKKRYKKSNFSHTGGFKRTYKRNSSRSYRNVGSRVRGRGPGGGGK